MKNIVWCCLLLSAPLSAQSLGSQQLGKYDEVVAGTAGNLALRGPWMSKSWRRPLPRLIIWHAISAGYERFGDSAHGGRWDAHATRDFLGRELGYGLTELVIFLGRKVF